MLTENKLQKQSEKSSKRIFLYNDDSDENVPRKTNKSSLRKLPKSIVESERENKKNT